MPACHQQGTFESVGGQDLQNLVLPRINYSTVI
jgi:hypothetical protein